MRNLKGKREILYRRVSTTEQKKSGNSLHSQQNQLIKFCQNNQIHNLKEFEEDYSAKNFNIPEWSKLNKYAKENYKDNSLHCKQSYFNESGKPIGINSLVNGINEGIHSYFDEDGNLQSERNFVNGILEGMATDFYKNGQKKTEAVYVKDGLKQGKCSNWLENGNLILIHLCFHWGVSLFRNA